MFIRFVCGETNKWSHVQAGLFCAAYRLRDEYELPEYELNRLMGLLAWFNVYLRSPFEYRLRKSWRGPKAICWFKSSAHEHLEKARDLISLLEENDIYISTIKSETVGYKLYEDDAQVLAQPFADMRRNFLV